MNRLEYLLSKLAEEAAEVAQMALKCQQFGLDEVYKKQTEPLTNKERLWGELDDVCAIIELLNAEFNFNFVGDRRAVELKKIKVGIWAEYSKSLGLTKNDN